MHLKNVTNFSASSFMNLENVTNAGFLAKKLLPAICHQDSVCLFSLCDQIRCEWKFIAAVMDRILLFVYIIVTMMVTALTFVTAPNIFETIDQDAILRKMEESSKYSNLVTARTLVSDTFGDVPSA